MKSVTLLNDRVEESRGGHRFAWEIAKERLCALMIGGALPFDRPLSERSLAEAIELGRMPVREALRDLVRDGVVVTEAARGTFIRRLSVDEIRELYEVRLAMEGFAAHAAAEKKFVGDLPAISRALGKLRRSTLKPKEVADAEMLGDQLHWAVMQGANNRTLVQFYSGVRLRIRISLRLLQRRESDRIRETVDEHIAIAEAVLEHDAALALERMRHHLRQGYDATLMNFDNVVSSPDAGQGLSTRVVGIRKIRKPSRRR